MNTALLDSAAIDRSHGDSSTEDSNSNQIRTPPKPADPDAKERPVPLPIAVLTNDPGFADRIRVALDSGAPVTLASTTDDAVALASAGQCSILITDTTITRNSLETLTQRLRAHAPAIAIVVSGSRDHSGLFVELQSAGTVDAFLLKPITTTATQLVVEAATRRYRSYGTEVSQAARRMRERTQRAERALSLARDFESGATIEAKVKPKAHAVTRPHVAAIPQRASPAQKSWLRPSWSLIAFVAVIAAGVGAWTLSQRSSGINRSEIVAQHLAQAEAAFAAKRLLDARDGAVRHYRAVLEIDPGNFAAQRGLDAVARELSKHAQAYMRQQKLADAAIALGRLRELQPNYAELPLLDAQLKALQDSFVVSRIAIQPPPPVVLEEAPIVHKEEAASRPATSRASYSVAHRAEESHSTPAPIPENSRTETRAPISSPLNTLTTSVAPPQIRSEIPTTPSMDTEPSSATPTVAPEVPQTQPEAPPERAKLLKYVAPEYPSEAYARRMEGWIEISMEIAPSGDVIAPRIEAGDKRQLFGRSALAAVRQWKYESDPKRAAGERSSVRLNFQMP